VVNKSSHQSKSTYFQQILQEKTAFIIMNVVLPNTYYSYSYILDRFLWIVVYNSANVGYHLVSCNKHSPCAYSIHLSFILQKNCPSNCNSKSLHFRKWAIIKMLHSQLFYSLHWCFSWLLHIGGGFGLVAWCHPIRKAGKIAHRCNSEIASINHFVFTDLADVIWSILGGTTK
jgi:hypothetical protein